MVQGEFPQEPADNPLNAGSAEHIMAGDHDTFPKPPPEDAATKQPLIDLEGNIDPKDHEDAEEVEYTAGPEQFAEIVAARKKRFFANLVEALQEAKRRHGGPYL